MNRASPDAAPVSQGASSIRRAGVVGAGQMGAGIAGILVQAGISTALVDLNLDVLERACIFVQQIVARGRQDRGASGNEVSPLLTTSTDLQILAGCDLVIEAVIEDETQKKATFRALPGVLGASALLASNTSTIPISKLAQAWPYPERFAGMHFFNPVHRMKLVEVIRGERTGNETVVSLVSLARRLGKSPIVVHDGPGFLTTRVLFPYVNQAMALLQEGAMINAIDDAAVRFGMATGPIALLDLVGLDTALKIAEVMAAAFPDRFAVNPLLAEMITLGRLGRKSGAGFRSSGQQGSPGVPDAPFEHILNRHRLRREPPLEEEITDRLFLSMLLEATRVLEEGIVRDAADVDLGVVLGLGFPPSRGGILAWCDQERADVIMSRLVRYEALGPAFDPPATLIQMAGAKRSFQER